MVRLSGGGGDWFWGESPVGGLNSGGEGMQIADFSLSIRGMQGVTDRNSLNWLFVVSCIVVLRFGELFQGVTTIFV